MPFNFNAQSFFGKLGPQSAGFNPNNAVAGFQRANAISGAVPNLFTTIEMTQKNQQDRRVKEAAIAQALAGLVKTRQDMDIQQQLAPVELAYKQSQVDAAPIERAYKMAETQYKLADVGQAPLKREKMMAEAEASRQRAEKDKSSIAVNKSLAAFLDKNLGADSANPEAVKKFAAAQSGLGEEDFDVEPITRMVRGVPITTFVPKQKAKLPMTMEKEYRGFATVGLGLAQNLKMLKDNPEFEKDMGPLSLKAARPGSLLGNIGNFMIKLDPKSKEFGSFKAETDKTFQKFRKETTGAQAALAELGWIAPDYPETSDNPELYKTKAVNALQRIAEGEQLLLDYWNKQGYRTSGLKGIASPAAKATNNSDISSMSDEELMKIASGS